MNQVRERLARAAALGCVCGLAAAALIVLPTDDLGLGDGLLLTGLITAFYVVVSLALMALGSVFGRLARLLGAGPRAFTTAAFLWGIALLVAAFTLINQANRSPAWKYSMHAWTVPLRVTLVVVLTWLIVNTWRNRSPTSAKVLRVERGLAMLSIPAHPVGICLLPGGQQHSTADVR